MTTATVLTADQIRQMTLEYNKDFPEAFADIKAGTVTVVASVQPSASGRRVKLTANVGVMINGGFHAATDVATADIARFRGNASTEAHAEWFAKKCYPGHAIHTITHH